MFHAYKKKVLKWNLDYGSMSLWYSVKSENKLKNNIPFHVFFLQFSSIFVIAKLYPFFFQEFL
jgi:hypothetical protein